MADLQTHNFQPTGKEVILTSEALWVPVAEAQAGLVFGRAAEEQAAQELMLEHLPTAQVLLAQQAAYSSWSSDHELRNHQLHWPCR